MYIYPSFHVSCSDTPSQRVQFILGTEEDEEHVAHELFTELDEICVKDGKDAEWKETARLAYISEIHCKIWLAPWTFNNKRIFVTVSHLNDYDAILRKSCLFYVRWLKFEEDVEDGGERWSKPYVATLSLHSLFELRSCIINGTVLLDMRANCIEEIAG